MLQEHEVVATGTWLYDGTVPTRMMIYKVPARLAPTRYNDDDELDESSPVPETPDGFIYVPSSGSDFGWTIDEAKRAADRSPWGPVNWD